MTLKANGRVAGIVFAGEKRDRPSKLKLQQQGTKSRAFTQGRYSSMESSVHGFDLMVADRYANDGVITPQARVSKERSAEALKDRARRLAQGQAAD